MKEKGIAIITGADGGMGQVITKALALNGFEIIMACLNLPKAIGVCERIKQETGNSQIEVRQLQLNCLQSVSSFCQQLIAENKIGRAHV